MCWNNQIIAEQKHNTQQIKFTYAGRREEFHPIVWWLDCISIGCFLVKCIQRNMSRKLLYHSCMVQMMDFCWHWLQLEGYHTGRRLKEKMVVLINLIEKNMEFWWLVKMSWIVARWDKISSKLSSNFVPCKCTS